MVICEAYALGTPVLASNIGSLSEIVKKDLCGDLFEPINSESICTVVTNLWNDQARLRRLAQGARDEYEKNYTEKINYSLLMEIYSKVISNKDQLIDIKRSLPFN
jgi:glycosyltransferase involved in cell wall biosynthesis